MLGRNVVTGFDRGVRCPWTLSCELNGPALQCHAWPCMQDIEARAGEAACPPTLAAPSLPWRAEFVRCRAALQHVMAIASSTATPALSLLQPASSIKVSAGLEKSLRDHVRALEAQHGSATLQLVVGSSAYDEAMAELADFEIALACSQIEVSHLYKGGHVSDARRGRGQKGTLLQGLEAGQVPMYNGNQSHVDQCCCSVPFVPCRAHVWHRCS